MAHPKGLLIEQAQKLGLKRPEFSTARSGPEHEPLFLTDVIVAGEVVGTGQGGSKREAERAAAEEALTTLANRADGGAKKRPARRTKAAAPKAETPSSREHEEPEAEEFGGPWPMLEGVLAAALNVAERRVLADLRGDEALDAVRDFTLRLYKDLLADLGEVVEVEDDAEGEA